MDASAREGTAGAGAARRLLRRATTGTVIGLAAGALAALAAQTRLVDTWERRTLDMRVQSFARAERADPGIVAVVIDQRSLDAIAAPRQRGGLEQGWPWPRDFHAAVLAYTLDAGARAVGVDLVLSEPSVYTRLGVADDDAALARASRGRPVVHAAVFTREAVAGAASRADHDWPPGMLEQPFTRAVSVARGDAFNAATLPVAPLLGATRGLGWIGFEPDPDGTCRSIGPAAVYAPMNSAAALEIWSMPLALAAVLGERIEMGPGRPARERLSVGGRGVPLDEHGRMLLRFHGGEGAYRQYSFAKVLESAKRRAQGLAVEAARPEEFRDKIVLIGATAAGLLDLRATSIGAVLPGYLIHATALDNLLHGDALRRPSTMARVGLLLLVGAVGGLGVAIAGSLRGGVVAILGPAVVLLAAALWAFESRGVWIDLVPPGLALLVAYGGASAYGYATEGRERRFLRAAFSRYLAPEVVEELVARPGRLALGGEMRDITVMFADVAGFTALAEASDPRRLVTLMNECFEEITRVIQRHGGTVDKFIGDAVMAFWNAPVEHPDHAARGARAARDVLAAVARLDAQWRTQGRPPLSMRVGLATGPSLVGNVGSSSKFNYTAMGDTVNLASRLEGAAKVYHTLSLVAGSTVGAARDAVRFREIDWLQVKGRSEPVTVFEVVGEDAGDPGRGEAYRLYAAGLADYRARRFAEAAQAFAGAVAADAGDGAARVMRDRCRQYQASPPPAAWRGEHVLTDK